LSGVYFNCYVEKGDEMGTRKFLIGLTILSFLFILAFSSKAQDPTNEESLKQLVETIKTERAIRQPQLYHRLLKSVNPAQLALNRNPDVQIMYIDDNGVPVYYITHNRDAATTIRTHWVWPFSPLNFNLDGSGTDANELAIWDSRGVLLTHQEFGGRVTQVDIPDTTAFHSTHVAGTMVAEGMWYPAKGMSFVANLSAYDWTDDKIEMANAATTGLQISNHSYASAAGWRLHVLDWYWFGDVSVSTVEDYGFGFYDSENQTLDQIAYDAPKYLMVRSAGNDRTDEGPGPGGGHYVWIDTSWVWSTETRDPDGGTDHYDCIGWQGNAKNILTVGAVEDIANPGYQQPSDVVQTVFSSWGPTDDGRIKPDIVANGDHVLSCLDGSDDAYGYLSGTSMAAPNASGSINLLVRHYENERGGDKPRSATVKAIVIHTADESGPADGPDYQNGWGLMNTMNAAIVIKPDSTSFASVYEGTLADGTVNNHDIEFYSRPDLRVTIVWTDPPGTPPSPALNPTTPMLVNDLDLRIEHFVSGTIYEPWVLDGADPSAAATRGDNTVDNVEVIDIKDAPRGLYRAIVSHKGTLYSGEQEYTIIWSYDHEIPTLSNWGMIGMTVLLVILGVTWIVRRRRCVS
jgi:hypothetical protein